MGLIAGVDGCPGGWVAAVQRGQDVEVRLVPLLRELVESERFDLIAVDIPLGLTDRGPRKADTEARAFLGPVRGTSVMPAPIRATAYARTRAEADAIRRSIECKGVGAQTFGIYAKVAEADRLMRESEGSRTTLVEAHPEVSFALWGGRPLVEKKKTAEGAAIRRGLVEREFGPVPDWDYPRRILGPDDVLDAYACLWTARRIVAGGARTFGGEIDAEGLPMRIVG